MAKQPTAADLKKILFEYFEQFRSLINLSALAVAAGIPRPTLTSFVEGRRELSDSATAAVLRALQRQAEALQKMSRAASTWPGIEPGQVEANAT